LRLEPLEARLFLAVSVDLPPAGAAIDSQNGGFDGNAIPSEIWNEDQKLAATDGAVADHFGHAVAIDAETLVVGTPHADRNGIDSGAAYVFEKAGSSWTQTAVLLADDASAGD
jgi:hypothetical protein